MIPELRRALTEHLTAERYQAAVAATERGCGGTVGFRLAESPIFVPSALVARMDASARELIGQLPGRDDWTAAVRERVDPSWFLDGGVDHPAFVQVDFALAKGDDGEVVPRLTELQGFPSIYAFQDALARNYADAYAIPPSVTHLASGLDREGLRALLGRAVLGDRAPETVALVDIHPWTQGTWPDFRFTQQLLPGLAVVCITELRRRGSKLFRIEDGREVPVERIYWRVVWDDLQQHRDDVPVRLDGDLDVEWANHPNDFFAWSKIALPFLRHPCAPSARFLDDGPWPDDLDRWVLKPLFSFGSRGLLLDPDRAALEAIPETERPGYVLQERFEYANLMEGPSAPIRAEVRLMYVWLDEPVLVTLMPRMSAGRIMGCAHNRTDPWTGHGVAFWPTS